MNIYKLKYKNKENAIADLIAKGVYNETEEGLYYGQGIHAIVEIGKIIEIEGTYDDKGNIITEPIFADSYHYDIMCEQEIDFGVADITDKIKNPKHSFAGYAQNAEGEVTEVLLDNE